VPRAFGSQDADPRTHGEETRLIYKAATAGREIVMAKAVELRDMSDEQLGLTLKEANENLFRLRIKQQTERLDAPSELRRNRRLVARIKTIQTQRAKKAAAAT
jgi:large subunit ribosomal protein L29